MEGWRGGEVEGWRGGGVEVCEVGGCTYLCSHPGAGPSFTSPWLSSPLLLAARVSASSAIRIRVFTRFLAEEDRRRRKEEEEERRREGEEESRRGGGVRGRRRRDRGAGLPAWSVYRKLVGILTFSKFQYF